MAVNNRKIKTSQVAIIGSFVLLLAIGLLFVASSSYASRSLKDVNPYTYTIKHMFFVVGAVVVFVVGSAFSIRFWRAALFVVFPFSLILSFFVLHFGEEINGAKRWIDLKVFSLQPTEFLKIGLILALAYWCGRKDLPVRKMWPGFSGAVILTSICAFVCMLQNDLGTALVMGLIGFAMLFAAGARKRHLVLLGLMSVMLVLLAIKFAPHRVSRIDAWLNPWEHKKDKAYQVVHSYYALGEGGWFGVGLSQGRAKYYIPAPHTDFVFATVAEETGVVGPLFIMALFTTIGYFGVQLAYRAKTEFARLVTVGAVSYLCGQAFLNMAVVTGLFPCTGIPLPFISYGGSSLVACALAVALLISVSRGILNSERVGNDEGFDNRWGNRRPRLSSPGRSLGSSKSGPRNPTPVRR